MRTPAFQLFIVSAVATTAGLWFFELSLYWVALSRTGSATATGLILGALILPILLLVVPMGVITDRWGDRRLLMISQAAWIVTMVVAAIIASRGLLTFPIALALALLEGIFDAVWVVPAQVFLARIVERPLMAKAIALGTLQVALGRIVGGYAAGLILSISGPAIAFLVGAVCLLVGLLAMSRVTPAHTFTPRRVSGGFREGLRFLRATPAALILCVLGSCTALFLYGYLSLLPVVSRDLLHAGSQGLGMMTAAGGMGTLAVVWAIDPVGRLLGRGVALVGSVGVASVAIALIGISRSVPASVFLAGVITGSLIFYSATNTTLLQALAPTELRGRVLAFFGFAFWAIMPVGSIASGYIVDHVGIGSTLLAMGILETLGVAVMVAVYRPLVMLDVSADGLFTRRQVALREADKKKRAQLRDSNQPPDRAG